MNLYTYKIVCRGRGVFVRVVGRCLENCTPIASYIAADVLGVQERYIKPRHVQLTGIDHSASDRFSVHVSKAFPYWRVA